MAQPNGRNTDGSRKIYADIGGNIVGGFDAINNTLSSFNATIEETNGDVATLTLPSRSLLVRNQLVGALTRIGVSTSDASPQSAGAKAAFELRIA